MKKSFIIGIAIILAAVCAIQFVRVNNDHRECEEKVEQWKNVKGETVRETQHVCKEAFSF